MEKESNLHVVIGDDVQYSVRGFGSTFLNLEFGMSLHLSDILFVLGIKRNLISISALEDKGYQSAFSEGKVLAWPKKSSIKSAHVIGNRYDSLYKLSANPIRALIHEASESTELWRRRLDHLHYQALHLKRWLKVCLNLVNFMMIVARVVH